MKGLIFKDLLLLRSFWKNYVPLILIYAVISAVSKSASILVTLLCMLIILIPTTTLTLDETAKWETLALTMPVSRKQIVGAKYVLSILTALAGTAITTAVMFAVSRFPSVSWSFAEEFPALPGGLFSSLLMISIMLPLLFKYGIARARIMFLLVVVGLGGVIFIVSSTGVLNVMTILAYFYTAIIIGGVFFAALALVLSFLLSCRIYEKKDF